MKAKVLPAVLIFSVLCTLLLPVPAHAESLTIDPTQGTVGSDVKIPAFCQYGQGDYFLYWGEGNQLISQGTVKSGTCQPITFKVPQSPRGKQMITLKVGSKSFQKEYTVLASISMAAKKGAVGSTVSIQGSGFAAKESGIKIMFNGNEAATGIEANETGSWIYTFKIPTSARGNHPITAVGTTTPSSEIKDQLFAVTPVISINPNSGWVGRVVNVSGAGFAAAETNVAIMYDDTVVKTGLTADLNGSWQSTFSVPASAKGSHKVDAKGATTPIEDVPDTAFTVSPGIKVEQASGRLGDVIGVGDTLWASGVGFQENEAGIKVTFDSMQVADNVAADVHGSWSAQFEVPACTKGEHKVDSFGDATKLGDVTHYIVVVTPELTINPNNGAIGENTILSGSAFGANQPLTIIYNSQQVTTSATTDAKGSFSTGFKPPASGSGSHMVTVSDPSQAIASTMFTVESVAPGIPQPIAPEPGTKLDFLDSKPIEFKWSVIEDPSSVVYALELSQKADFSGSVVRKENLTTPSYSMSGTEKPGIGEYYWRVKAIDGAGNSSEWSQSQLMSISGFEFWWIGLVVIGILVIAGLVIWRIRVISKKGGWTSEE
ncbi:MAG: hypothetical protein PHO26_05280 [Dehalococcoidia bacterium]|nr:hypothetical protein [Dehalococcoidia bacterium]MDD5494349.1 hypothetical protein [Dehalococcoidia bacterium]